MKNNKKYEGKTYKFKKNSIIKTKKKYNQTYQYVLEMILKYTTRKKAFLKIIKIDEEKNTNQLLMRIMESTAKDFKLDNNQIYSYNKFNRKIIKEFNKQRKLEKKNQIEIKLKIVKLYKMIEQKDFKDLRKIAFEKPNDFLKALYLYTICED